jgi:hypothetical protein
MSGLLREKACRHATGHKSRKEASAHQRRKSRLVRSSRDEKNGRAGETPVFPMRFCSGRRLVALARKDEFAAVWRYVHCPGGASNGRVTNLNSKFPHSRTKTQLSN